MVKSKSCILIMWVSIDPTIGFGLNIYVWTLSRMMSWAQEGHIIFGMNVEEPMEKLFWLIIYFSQGRRYLILSNRYNSWAYGPWHTHVKPYNAHVTTITCVHVCKQACKRVRTYIWTYMLYITVCLYICMYQIFFVAMYNAFWSILLNIIIATVGNLAPYSTVSIQ